MEYVCPVNEVEQQLKEAGEQLALPPSSTKNLLELLDKIEELLAFVGQAPSISMQGALVPSMGALIGDELIKHPDVDVRVSVASCLCEVARITAPEPPYKDEIMKEIFQLHMLAFGELSDMSGRSYYKAVHILESVAKVKSCLLMLDLECDSLVLEMFEQFLSKIRSNHPHTIFSDMESVMTSVIEESDEIATELLNLLISHVRKENQNSSPLSWKLAEKVLRNCNDTLKSYSETIKKLIKSDFDGYAEVVTLLCQNAYGNELVVTKSTKTNSIHKRDLNTLENGGSTKKYIDTQRVETVSKLIDTNRLKGKEPKTSGKGRPKNKKNNLNQDNRPNLVQNSTGKPEKQSIKKKDNIETSGSLYNVVIKKEGDALSDYGVPTPSVQQMNDKIQNRRKTSSKKRVADGSRGKDNLKKPGDEFVGHRIKVWWPLDKMYYEGAVSFYDPIEKKHTVLYADGDEELLNLYKEKWMMLDETSPDQAQVAELPIPESIPAKRLKQKGKRKLEYSPMQEDNSRSPKSSPAPVDSSKVVNCENNSPAPADSSKTEPTKEHDIVGADTSNVDLLCNVDNQKDDPVQTPDVSCELKLTEKPIDNLKQDGEPNPSGELEEKRLPESSETTQILEKKDELVCETLLDDITA